MSPTNAGFFLLPPLLLTNEAAQIIQISEATAAKLGSLVPATLNELQTKQSPQR